MRDIIIALIVFGSLPLILRNAYIGVLVWSWLSYMNPHRLAWGFAYDFPFAQIVAITLFLGVIFSKDLRRFPINNITVPWFLFLVWMGISTVLALEQDEAILQLIKILKIQLITILTILTINTRQRINLLIWIIIISIGYYGVKGGIFTLITGGQHRVWGPSGSFIEDNNELAVAILMTIPLVLYLWNILINKWIKYGLVAVAGFNLLAVLGTQSRGALLAVGTVLVYFWLKSNKKLVTGLAAGVLIASAFAFMPSSWQKRMESITNYQDDASAMGRLNAWAYSFNVANARLTGGGLNSWFPKNFLIYAPRPDVHSAHSIYFGVLADHGWIGLILFLIIFINTWRTMGWIRRSTRGESDDNDVIFLANMIQISLVAYLSGGAFLSLSYFDLPWHLISIVVILQALQKDKMSEPIQESSAPKDEHSNMTRRADFVRKKIGL